MPERKSVWSESASADLTVYAQGVQFMKDRSKQNKMDPLGWWYQSRMHGNPPGNDRTPDEPQDWSQCRHGSWFFLPWHRMYLIQFERTIRSLTGQADWALPYWDYPDAINLEVPPPFLDQESPLFDSSRSLGPPTILAPPTWARSGTFVAFGGDREASPTDFHNGEFPGTLEGNPHNLVHGRLSGNMASFQSPLDPIFWIHHCNIDRLWEVWLTLPNRSNPTETAWLDTVFEFPDPEKGRRPLRVTEITSTAAAGYSYESLAPAPAERALFGMLTEVTVEPRQDDDLELLGATPGGGSVRERVEIQPIRRALERRRSLLTERELEEGELPLFLRLENTGIQSGDASSMWNVYIRGNSGERHLAGTIAPFGLAGLTARGGRQTITLDVSHLSKDLIGGDAESVPVEVTFEPAYEGTEGEPFWERAALYTTTE